MDSEKTTKNNKYMKKSKSISQGLAAQDTELFWVYQYI